MQSHDDNSHGKEFRKLFSNELLEDRAKVMKKHGLSRLTDGNDDEGVIREYRYKTVAVKQLPDDVQGLLRISLGGGETESGLPFDYCVFRGDKDKCRALIKRALRALAE